MNASFDDLVAAAESAPKQGWSFSWLDGRITADPLPWEYDDLARAAVGRATALLDVDTGGGELLTSFQPFPDKTVATEGYAPNLRLARDRLTPLGVDVRAQDGRELPAADGEFDLVLNRHGHFDAEEVWRVLRPAGRVVAQHVGVGNDREFNVALGAPDPVGGGLLERATADLIGVGFDIVDAQSAHQAVHYKDIGAVVYQLLRISWQVPDFTVAKYETELRAIHQQILRDGSFVVHNHRFFIDAVKP
jgi:SAM-dependent methyltransferase